MILQCKNCNARYLVPDNSIGVDGRTVRCARCSHSWFEQPLPSDTLNPPTDNTPDFDTMIGNINAAVKPLAAGSNLPAHRSHIPAGLKAMVAILIIFSMALSLFITMPKVFGIAPSKGLVLSDIKIRKNADEKTSTVEITGNILNNSDELRNVPKIRVILLDGANNPLQSWEFKSNGEALKSKETIPFSTGDLNIKFSIAKRFVIDMGTPIELALRRKPQ
jgi:predicted Zn finger-like uncharacterized protein